MCNSRVREFPAVARHVHVIASTNFLFQRPGTTIDGAKTSLSTIRLNIYVRPHVGLYTGEKTDRTDRDAHTSNDDDDDDDDNPIVSMYDPEEG